MENVTLIRSRRKSIGLELKTDGTLLVRAPYRMPEADIRRFLAEKEAWIVSRRERLAARRQAAQRAGTLTSAELEALRRQAKEILPRYTAHFAAMLGTEYRQVVIRTQRSRWGSCSSRGTISLNCLLMLAPPEVQEYVAAHEVCHLTEMNHSARFYALLSRVLPDWKSREAWLRENGQTMMLRLPDAD